MIPSITVTVKKLESVEIVLDTFTNCIYQQYSLKKANLIAVDV